MESKGVKIFQLITVVVSFVAGLVYLLIESTQSQYKEILLKIGTFLKIPIPLWLVILPICGLAFFLRVKKQKKSESEWLTKWKEDGRDENTTVEGTEKVKLTQMMNNQISGIIEDIRDNQKKYKFKGRLENEIMTGEYIRFDENARGAFALCLMEKEKELYDGTYVWYDLHDGKKEIKTGTYRWEKINK